MACQSDVWGGGYLGVGRRGDYADVLRGLHIVHRYEIVKRYSTEKNKEVYWLCLSSLTLILSIIFNSTF
jgi:hypothetical protein